MQRKIVIAQWNFEFQLVVIIGILPRYHSKTLLLSTLLNGAPLISVLNIVITRCLLVLHSFLTHVSFE